MLKAMTLTLILCMMLPLLAEQIKLTTPGGEITLELNNVDDHGQTSSKNIVDEIAAKLEKLEKDYHSKLGRLDQNRAKNLVDEIFALLALLPEDASVNVQSSRNETSIKTTTITQTQPVIEQAPQHPQPNRKPDPAPVQQQTQTTVVVESNVKPPMNEASFNSLCSNIKAESFSDDQLGVLQLAIPHNYFSINQLIRLVGLFTYSEDQIQVVRMVYPRVSDKENAHNLISAFTYSEDKEAVRQIIQTNR